MMTEHHTDVSGKHDASRNAEEADADPSPARRKTRAWSEEDDKAGEVRPGEGESPPLPQFQRPVTMAQRLAISIVVVQAIWAICIPIKSFVTITTPTVRSDATKTMTMSYLYSDPGSLTALGTTPLVIRGVEIVPLLQSVLDITLSSPLVRRELEDAGCFDVASISNILTLEETAVVSKYAALLHQTSEFPGGVFTPRAFHTDDDPALLRVLLRDSTSTTEVRDIPIDLKCSSDQAFLRVVRCVDTTDNDLCSAETAASSESFQDIDLKPYRNGTGLANNIGLLFVVDYFQRAMSTVFANKDWKSAVADLGFEQTTSKALEKGSASAFKGNFSYLMDTDAFLMGIQASEMQTLLLDSCLASELVVAQFYTRTFVLSMIQNALLRAAVYSPRALSISVPATISTILAPMFEFDISLTSGARYSSIKKASTWFLEHFRVATITTFANQVKGDRKLASAAQVAGSSIAMLQAMAYYPDLMSRVVLTTAGDHDVQIYQLVGRVGTGINTFKDSFSANSLMVYPLVELPRDVMTVPDVWWDDEAVYAAAFHGIESTVQAPFRHFNQHLVVKSMSIAGAGGDPATRCQRAMFKVFTKIVYLALLELSSPTSYLMFMGDVATGAKNWLINQIYLEELVGESFSGERIGISYRNGDYQDNDDGSSWVIVPLLTAMLENFGLAVTKSAILDEIERSFALFMRTSNGIVHFPDTPFCRVSGTTGTEQEVVPNDLLEDVLAKILGGLQASAVEIITEIADVATFLRAQVAAEQVPWVTIPSAQIMGTRAVSNTSQGIGPPTEWTPTVITAGMLKLWPPKTPTDAAIQKYRNAQVCYTSLEVRSLNPTTRCFLEPHNYVIVLKQFESEMMRKFFLNLWSLSIMLSTMAGVVVLKYLRRLGKAWRITSFEFLEVGVALQMNLQGIGVLNISQTLLLLASSLPTLIGFHIPNDSVFMPRYLRHEKLPKVWIDILVTLSMSWFLKLGFEVCNRWVHAKHPVDWQYLYRLRLLLLVGVLVARLLTAEKVEDGQYMMWRLVLTCVLSLLLGACCTFLLFVPDRKSKVIDGSIKQNQDAVIAALVQQNLPLSRYGVLGRTAKGWSRTGLIMEGWRLARNAAGRDVWRKDGGEIELDGGATTASHISNSVQESKGSPSRASSNGGKVTL